MAILFFGFTELYPQEYKNLKIYLFSDDVFYRVEGESMLPTFQDQEMWYGSPCKDDACRHSIHRGDIVIFNTRHVTGMEDTYIKRVIGMPREHITIFNEKVYVNSHLLIELYISTIGIINQPANCRRYDLGPDQILVLGDNRSRSNDSRTFGPVEVKDIWGISRFEEYNSMEDYPRLDTHVELGVNETECPVWIKN